MYFYKNLVKSFWLLSWVNQLKKCPKLKTVDQKKAKIYLLFDKFFKKYQSNFYEAPISYLVTSDMPSCPKYDSSAPSRIAEAT